MKKIGVLFLVALLSLQLALAVEINNLEGSYDQAETLIVKFSGNFVTKIARSNVFFYHEHVRVPMDFELVEANEDYYVYAFLPENFGNYSISIEGVEYMKGTSFSDENIVGEFFISDSLAMFSVDPGVIVAENDFILNVQNLQQEKITINYQVLVGETEEEDSSGGGFWSSLFGGNSEDSYVDVKDGGNSLDLKSGEERDIEFNLGNISESGLRTVELNSGNSSYSIPVYVYSNLVEENVTENETIIEDKNETIIEMKNETLEPEDETVEKEMCEDLGAVKCEEDETCNGTVEQSRDDGLCCVGVCEKEKGVPWKFIGWIIIICVIIFLVWFIKTKYMRAKKVVNVMDVAIKGVEENVFRKRR